MESNTEIIGRMIAAAEEQRSLAETYREDGSPSDGHAADKAANILERLAAWAEGDDEEEDEEDIRELSAEVIRLRQALAEIRDVADEYGKGS